MAAFESLSYDEAAARVGESVALQRRGPSGADYNVEIEIRWEHKKGGAILILGGVDDGGASAFKPLMREKYLGNPKEQKKS